MKKINLILLILFLIPITLADYTVEIPNYLDSGVSEQILVYDSVPDINKTTILILEGMAYVFTESSDYSTYSLNVLGTGDDDLHYDIYVVNSSYDLVNYSDNTNESILTITNSTSYFGVKKYANTTHVAGYIENHELCPYIGKSKGTPQIQFQISYNNGTELKQTNSTTFTVTNLNASFHCYSMTHTYDTTLINFTEYYTLKCLNCGTANELILGKDTTTVLNKSVYTSDFSTIYNLSGANYMFKILELEGVPDYYIDGDLLIRIPYYITVELYDTINTTFDTNFDYIYLRKATNTQTYSQLGSMFTTGILGFISSAGTPINIDYTETFWGPVNVNSAQIKLYDAGNYSINLLSLKTFLETGWNYEFIKPQYTKKTVDTRLDKFVFLETKTNGTVNIRLSSYEANKSDFFFNIFKWLFIIAIFIIGIVVSFTSPAPMYGLGGIFLITLILIKLLGVHI